MKAFFSTTAFVIASIIFYFVLGLVPAFWIVGALILINIVAYILGFLLAILLVGENLSDLKAKAMVTNISLPIVCLAAIGASILLLTRFGGATAVAFISLYLVNGTIQSFITVSATDTSMQTVS